jgi:XRE family transcriptional regulator, master regulator for biofilm formation
MLSKIAWILKVDVGDLVSEKNKIETSEDLKADGLKWVLVGNELEKEGITPEQVREWAEIVKSLTKK